MKTDPEILKSLLKEGRLLPQEEMLEIARKKGSLKIGIPREDSFQERRVALVPEAVSLLVANGHDIKIETKAGENANFSDRAYSEAGAEIVYDRNEVFQCDIVFKVSPPIEEEVEMMGMGQTLISALQISMQPKQILQKMMQKKITAIAWDYMRDDEGHFPVVSAMGEIAGNTSIHIAAELLNAFKNGKGVMLGGIAGVQPTEVVILGAGTVGEFAARSAMGLGCSVKVFDNSLGKLRRLQSSVGQRIYTSIIQPKVLSKALMRADVVIGAVRSPFGKTPCIVSEEMVGNMKTGSVIIDVSIDQGGCFETSELTNHESPTFDKYGVTHYCVPNIASRVSRTASFAISNIFAPVLIKMGEKGGDKELIKRDHGFRSGVYMYKGTLTSEVLGKIFDLNYKEIELLLMGM
ncbi:alanine dehydrogenase [Brumimicrobium oceani]|uniref:alanine dehydrogenase n=1 Tax=Brumimicrobium oceani TaxID=2100725 RepID=A0A2U2XGK7_9FLAO|nr:alanine dehydrogenase [Brumimicrobium oceani]PWH86939.1 alanine dehydrogenase [Brumimicrobium oceani]